MNIDIWKHVSSLDYSFVNAGNDFMKNIRELIRQCPSDHIFQQLFENFCLINGYIYSILLPLQQHNEQSDPLEATLFVNNLNQNYDLFATTKSLLKQHLTTYSHLPLFTTIQSAYYEFSDHVKVPFPIELNLIIENLSSRFFVNDGWKPYQRRSTNQGRRACRRFRKGEKEDRNQEREKRIKHRE